MTDTKQYTMKIDHLKIQSEMRRIALMEEMQNSAKVHEENILLQATINDLKEELKKSKQQTYKMVYALGSALDGDTYHEVQALGLPYPDTKITWQALQEAIIMLRENNWISPDEYNLK